MLKGSTVRFWTGNQWQVGRFLKTFERGKRKGMMQVEYQKMTKEGFKWRKMTVLPDYVEPC